MNEDLYKGYKGAARQKLIDNNVKVWSDVIIKAKGGEFEGIILPRAETADDRHIVIKMPSGYNTGFEIENIESIKEMGYKEAHYKIPEKEFPYSAEKPNVTLLGTGGTIASRLDYRTGAVIPAFTPGELYGAVPELADVCNLTTRKLFGIFSENMGAEQYIALANAIGEEVEKGCDGIIIGHGTDTMHHTAAALSFMVQDTPVPVVMVGSQRSSDRPSSDAALNLRCAAYTAAHADIAEVMVCMFGPTSDLYNLLHPGTRVRKMHSSYRDTFRTIGDIPIARVTPDSLTHIKHTYLKRDKNRKPIIKPYFNEKVTILYYYPNMKPDIVEAIIEKGYEGIVIAGTGLGHVNRPLYEPLKKAIQQGIKVYMTVQTLWGYAQMYVYDTGRDLMHLGIIPLDNMLPEVAYIKLAWVLGQTDDPAEVEKMMRTPIAHETTPREPFDGYLIYQGGLPEIEKFISSEVI
ncbi:MAG: Glu-tRNA(Gln) amidotransferase subunit GatD [Acidobacteria bacterium]|nr:Glu-tRNA(Gln) amidotransferase subunit GatD [Acidobacteriota bacterium]